MNRRRFLETSIASLGAVAALPRTKVGERLPLEVRVRGTEEMTEEEVL